MPFVLLPDVEVDERYAWIEPDGTEHLLNIGTGYGLLPGRAGPWNMPITYAEDRVPLQMGTRLRNAVVNPREIDVPIIVYGETKSELFGRVRNLARWVDGTNPAGPGQLKCYAPDGSTRTIICYGSIEAGEGEDERYFSPDLLRVALILHAPDPFWYDDQDDTETFTLQSGAHPFFPFEFPFRVPSSTVLGTTTIENVGDVLAWPVWTITGPGQVPVVRNRDTGEATGVNIELEAGEQIIIDTRPDMKSVTDGQGGNLFPLLTPNSSLWYLPTGFTEVQVEMSGASAASSVVVSWRPRFWTP